MKTIAEFRRAMIVGSFWDVTLLWNNGKIWLPTKQIVSGECVRVSTNRFTINNGVEDLNVDFPTGVNFHPKKSGKIEISTTRIKKFKLIISKSK
jgi:hypothetical protein